MNAKPNLFERAIAVVAPSYAVTRAMSRMRLDVLTARSANSGYDGAASGRRTTNWKTSGRDANAVIAPSLQILRNRSRDLRRNNPYAAAAMSYHVDNLISYGIKPQVDDAVAAAMWAKHAETTGIDYDGLHDVYGQQALAVDTMVEAGGVLIRRYLLTTAQQKAKGLALPYQQQVLEPEFLDMTRDGPASDGSVDIRGIRIEQNGGIRGYWLFDEHPGSSGLRTRATSRFVPARDIIHLFRVDRPGQLHGVPWAAPVMLRLKNFDDYEDAQIERQRIAACFAAFMQGFEGAPGEKAKIEIKEKIEPGMISFTPPGTTVEFGTPPTVEGYKDFSSITLHAVAAGIGVPYEAFGDLNGVNFSSGRMGWQQYQRRVDRWQWQTIIPRMCMPMWDWFDSSLQFTGNTKQDVQATHIPPRRIMVNPKEEVTALVAEIRSGLTTWPQAITERGLDPKKQAQGIADANKMLDDLDIKLDCDPRFALPAGSAGKTQDDSGDGGTQKKATD